MKPGFVLVAALAVWLAGAAVAQQSVASMPRSSYEGAETWVRQNLKMTDHMMPESTAIFYAKYYLDGGIMLVSFQSNPAKAYIYERVPEPVWRAWKAAPSKGRFYNEQIKGRYGFELR